MTYEQLLRRYLELAAPGRRRAAGWLDVTFLDRFEELLDRALARVHPETSGPIERITFDVDDLAAGPAAVDTLVASYPEAASCRLHPADVHFFVEVCRRPGKPVNFVPVIDADVRRWWRSDSLWQAHDESYGADQVIVIPGPVAGGGITVWMSRWPTCSTGSRRRSSRTLSGPRHLSQELPRAGAPWVTARPCSTPRPPPGRGVGRSCGAEPAAPLEGVPSTLVPDAEDTRCSRFPSPGRPAPALDLSGGRERSAAGDLRGVRHRAMGALLALTAGGRSPEVVDRHGGGHADWSTDLIEEPHRRTAGAHPRGDAVADPQEQAMPDALVGSRGPRSSAHRPGGKRDSSTWST